MRNCPRHLPVVRGFKKSLVCETSVLCEPVFIPDYLPPNKVSVCVTMSTGLIILFDDDW